METTSVLKTGSCGITKLILLFKSKLEDLA